MSQAALREALIRFADGGRMTNEECAEMTDEGLIWWSYADQRWTLTDKGAEVRDGGWPAS